MNMRQQIIQFIQFGHVKMSAFAALAGVMLLTSCGKPGGTNNNFTHSLVSVLSVNDNKPLQSDTLTKGYGTDDIVTVKFKSESSQLGTGDKNPTDPDGLSPFDRITLHTYHVTHQRSDGGPVPSDFTGGMNLTLAPNAEGEASIVIVRAFDKNRSPLQELRSSGQIFATSIMTFYGQDGYGNDLAVQGSLAISFANFADK